MKLRSFSIFDVKADSYSPPFHKASVGLALRDFQSLVNDKGTTPGKYPGDFKLLEVGSFDDSTGIVEPCEHVSLGFGTDFVERDATVRKIG